MADRRIVMSPADVLAMKQTLCAQQELLQKLQNELDAEREASASAADEALNVIHRLQEEKAAVKMESEQYKRLAEEKMCHAEESFAVIEDIILERELEVADLEYQLQTYRYKLLSLGWVDPGDGELKLPGHLWQRSRNSAGRLNLQTLGRTNSEPVLVECKNTSGLQTPCLDPDLISKMPEGKTRTEVNDLVSGFDKKNGNSAHEDSYADHIRELNARVKEIMGANYTTQGSAPDASLGDLDEVQQSEDPKTLLNKDVIDCSSSPTVHDVFEVPQIESDCRSSGSLTKDEKNTSYQAGEIYENKDVVHLKGIKPSLKDEHNLPKKDLCKASDMAGTDRDVIQLTARAAQSDPSLNHLERTSAINQDDRQSEFARRAEKLKYLKEIIEELNSIHNELRSQMGKKSSRNDNTSVPEAMLHFWL